MGGNSEGPLVSEQPERACPYCGAQLHLVNVIPRFGDRPEIRILTCHNCERSHFVTNGSHWVGG